MSKSNSLAAEGVSGLVTCLMRGIAMEHQQHHLQDVEAGDGWNSQSAKNLVRPLGGVGTLILTSTLSQHIGLMCLGNGW